MNIRQSYGQQIRKPIIYSAIIHLAIFMTLAVAPGVYFPFMDKSMKIDVMWVELPKGTSEDIGLGVKQAEGLPKSTIEEQKQIFQPEPAPAQKPVEPEMKAPPAPAKVEKAKPEKRPEPDTSKMKLADKNAKPAPMPRSKADRKIANALANIDKQLAGRQVVPEAGQVSQAGEGYKYGTSDKPLRVSPRDPEYLKYQAMVRGKIIRSWIVPAKYSSDEGKNFSARLEVMVNMDGDVVSTRWQKSSGNPSFDQSAVRAVRNASPFPKPPDRLAWETYNEGFLVEFDARLKPQ